MKTNTIQDLGNFSGTILIPVFESEDKNSDTIVFDGLPIPSKIFSGIKDFCGSDEYIKHGRNTIEITTDEISIIVIVIEIVFTPGSKLRSTRNLTTFVMVTPQVVAQPVECDKEHVY